MMDTHAVRAVVRDTVAEIVGYRVEDSEPIVSSGLIDSLSVVKLITRLEQKLRVVIPPANLQPDDFDNVDLIVEALERQAR
ncbi:MAG: acyl carrier protein [Candidatus Acidiferrales bacterium]|jgi:acyl carrier protein